MTSADIFGGGCDQRSGNIGVELCDIKQLLWNEL